MLSAKTTVELNSLNGSILDGQNDAITDITAGGLVTLNAHVDIAGIAGDGRLELADNISVAAHTQTGDISLRGIGALTLHHVTTNNRSVNAIAAGTLTATNLNSGTGNVQLSTTSGGMVVASVQGHDVGMDIDAGDVSIGNLIATGLVDIDAGDGNVRIGSIVASNAVEIDSARGAILDEQDDALVDVTAGTTIRLRASTDIAGKGIDGRLELANQSDLDAQSTIGDIAIQALGAITLSNLIANDGAIRVDANGPIRAINVDTTGVDTSLNRIQLFATGMNGDVIVHRVYAGPNQGDVTIEAARNLLDGADVTGIVDISGHNLRLTAIAGRVGGSWTDLFRASFDPLEVNATGNLFATAPTGSLAIAPTVGGNITLSAPDAVLVSAGDLTVTSLNITATTNLALIADSDRNGVGTLAIGGPLELSGDLRIQAADVAAGLQPIRFTANRIAFRVGTSETISIADSGLDANPVILDAMASGNLTVNATAVELLDLDGDNVAFATDSLGGSLTLNSSANILVSDDVIAGFDASNSSTGDILINGQNIFINDAIVTDGTSIHGGQIQIIAMDQIALGLSGTLSPRDNLAAGINDDLIVITSIFGRIELRGGQLFMVDGSRLVAGRGSLPNYLPNSNGQPSATAISLSNVAIGDATVQIVMTADINLASVQSASNLINAIQIATINGSILDGGDRDIDLIANFDGAIATLQSVNGIGNANAIETSLFAVDVRQIALAANGSVALEETVTGGALNVIRAENSAGDIRIRVPGGDLRIVGAAFAPIAAVVGVDTNGGNIFLQSARDILVDAPIVSQGGHIHIDASDDVVVSADISAGQNLWIQAANTKVSDQSMPQVDGINILSRLRATNSILLQSSGSIQTAGEITSQTGGIGLSAIQNIDQSANAIASLGSLIIATEVGNYTMSANASNTSQLAMISTGGTISLGSVLSTTIHLTAGGDILDATQSSSQINLAGTHLTLYADGSIGQPAPGNVANSNHLAINAQVSTMAGRGDRIYIQSSQSVTIDQIAATSSSVVATGLLFTGGVQSIAPSLSLAVTSRSDLSAQGSVKLVATTGSITVNDGDANGFGLRSTANGDILVETRSADSNVQLNTKVSSNGGHISLIAARDLTSVDDIETSGSGTLLMRALAGNLTIGDGNDTNSEGLRTEAGDIVLFAGDTLTVEGSITSTSGGIVAQANAVDQNNDLATAGNLLVNSTGNFRMAAGSQVTAGNTLIVISQQGSTTLGFLSATTIGIDAFLDIVDGNNATLNLQADQAILRARTGSIGNTSPGQLPGANPNAIDTQLTTLAAFAQTRIFVQEADSLSIDRVNPFEIDDIEIEQVNFRSDPRTVMHLNQSFSGLSDVVSGGTIAIVTMTGSITIQDGGDGSQTGIVSNGNGDILLEARAASATSQAMQPSAVPAEMSHSLRPMT